MMDRKYLFMIFYILSIVGLVHADENNDAVSKKELIFQLHVDPMPIWEPKTLERRIKESSFILIGTPVRFRFIPEEAYKKHYSRIKNTPEYLKLEKEKAPFEDFQKYFDANPGSLKDFRFYDDPFVKDDVRAFLEFKIYKIMFKQQFINRKIDVVDKIIYFPIRFEYRSDGTNDIKGWNRHLGKKVIVLSEGYSPTDGTSIRMPFLQHRLVEGYHPLDKLPISINEISSVKNIAKSLGYSEIDLPPDAYNKMQRKGKK